MPTYDYGCAACGRRFEVVHGVFSDGPTTCPLCGKGPVRKVITAANVHYKGSGWAKKERRPTATAEAKDAGTSGGSDDASTTAAASSDDNASGSSAKTSEPGSSESVTAPASKPPKGPEGKTDKRSKSGTTTPSD